MRRLARVVLATLAALASSAAVAGAAPDPAASARTRLALDLLARTPAFARAAADSDTSLDSYLDEMADSTGDWFGLSAADRDTAGLDSALAWGLENEDGEIRSRRLRLGFGPYLAFNRVDGPVYGGTVSIGEPPLLGQLRGDLRYAVGPNEWMGGGSYRKAVNLATSRWAGRLWLGRETTGMDRDHPDWHLASVRAFLFGKDRRHYVGREGFEARIERETPTTRFAISYRDQRERALATTAAWNLLNRDLSVVENLAAARGRARELGFEAAVRAPFLPVILQVTHETSGPSLGSDFDYRRLRVAGSGDFGIAGIATVVPQASYGRLSGVPLPQQSFYLGGSHSVRSLSSNARAGTHMVVGRLDVLGAFDVLEALRLPHPDAFPIQAGVFASAGAAWGVDPFGGPTIPGGEWPRKETWISEAGLSLNYQPGIPDPTHLVRLSYAWPLGPGREETRWSLSYVRAIDLVKAPGGE